MTTATKWAYILIACIFVYLAFSAYATYEWVKRDPPFAYREDVYQPTVGDLCPGETLEAFYIVEIQDKPAVYMIVESIWSIDESRTVVYDDHPAYVVHDAATNVYQILRRTVPALDPGRYELRHAAQPEHDAADMFRVPFTIREGCP